MEDVEVSQETIHEEETIKKVDFLLWKKEDIEVIGKFLSGESLQKVEDEATWKGLTTSTDLEENEVRIFLKKANEFYNAEGIASLAKQSDFQKDEDGEISKKEYDYSVTTRSKVILSLVAAAFRKVGIWGPDESRRVTFEGGLRKPNKTGFSEIEYFDKKASQGLVPAELGGPEIKSAIKAPLYEGESRLGDRRVRRSLAHEIIHNLRALSNKNFWKEHEEKAARAKLRTPSGKREEKIGGFFVGSNKQGSEAAGELFAAAVDFKTRHKKEPTVGDILPDIARRFEESLKKESIKDKPKVHYLSARLALTSHLLDLQKAGFGQLPAIDLVSLASFGYISLEKAPELIRLGVITQEKYKKMREVIKNISDFLTSESESGFKLNTL